MKRALVMGWVAAVVSLASAGCGDDTGSGGAGGTGPTADVRYQSGTRLKVRVQRVGDVDQFAGAYDTELETPCTPAEMFDGSTRCVPVGGSASIVYLDAACTQPALSVYPGACDPTVPGFAREERFVDQGCSASYEVHAYEVGASISSLPAEVYANYGECTSQGPPGSLFGLTEVEPSRLVELRPVEAARGEALSVTYLESDDGFRLLGDHPTDVARGAACSPGLFADGVRCRPEAGYVATPAFTDDQCTAEIPGVLSVAEGCETPALALRSVPGATPCEPLTEVYELGASLPAAWAKYDGETCSEVDPAATSYGLGARLPDDQFPAVEVVEEGTGGVRGRGFFVDGSPLTPSVELLTEDGLPCFPYPFSDGSVRCGPPTVAYVPGPTFNRLYADAACTDVVVQINNASCFPIAAITTAVVVTGEDACGGFEPHAIGAEHPGGIFTADGVGGCIATTRDGNSAYRLLGAAKSPEEFVEVTVVTLD